MSYHTDLDRSAGIRHQPVADAHGRAALVLVESMLHSLLEVGHLTLDQALAAVRTASTVAADMAEETGELPDKMVQPIQLFKLIELSLETKGYDSENKQPIVPEH